MKIVIFYTVINREYQNACLLKSELEKRGHEVYIFHMVYTRNNLVKFNCKLDFTPDIVLTSFFYRQIHRTMLKDIFPEKVYRVINLQYEQIFSDDEKNKSLQLPTGKNKNAIHICWNDKFRKTLIENNICPENAVVTGSLNIDMCRERFISIYASKEDIAIKHKIDHNKKWILFISSLAMAEASEGWKNFHYNHESWGKEITDVRLDLDTKTRNIILDWVKEYLKYNDCEFIYRPHPSEEVSGNLYNIEKEFKNFHIIRDDSIRTWIKNCDKIHTWYSTSITEVYFMGKTCSILRPLDLPKIMHFDLLDSGKFTRTYDDFCYFNNNNIQEFPIDENLILDEFYIDNNKYAYEIICDLIEETVNKNIIMDLYD